MNRLVFAGVLLICICFHGISGEDRKTFNHDEFEGFEPAPPDPQDEIPLRNVKSVVEHVSETIRSTPLPQPRTYYVEGVFATILVVYGLVYWIGRRLNERTVRTHVDSILPLLKTQFSHIGDSDGVLVKESQSSFYVRAVGRQNCIGIQLSFELRRRQDLFSLLLELAFPSVDTLIIDVLLEDDAYPPVVFAVCKRREEKKLRKALKDLADFAGPASTSEDLPESLCVLSESDELAGSFLTPQVIQLLQSYESMVQLLHFSDQGIVSQKHKKSLQFKFKLPSEDAPEKGHLLLKLVFYLISVVPKLKLSKQAQQKAEKRRAELAEEQEKKNHQARQEAAQEKKLQKLKKTKESWANLSDAERQKKEEKLKEKELRKRMMKSAKVIHG
eukprot:TRINITY_DN20017_c0_g1_i1.p1 TRINITY_DN20017_c0_g1~~TRINITY_DN20017_c0_g1_i1.p1  ORF type:complete len:400 (-),score=-3.44 TRINITY_DN20017_c0_g1_i1:99-1259(-)